MKQIEVKCVYGYVLKTTESAILICKGKKEEVVPISNIQSFFVKSPGVLTPGIIKFSTAKAATDSVHIGFGVSAALGAEKIFNFYAGEEKNALRLRDYIVNFGNDQQTRSNAPAPSPADEIKKYKELLDMGAITPAEFNAKKKQLLGL